LEISRLNEWTFVNQQVIQHFPFSLRFECSSLFPTGIGFNNLIDPTPAAKSVGCIHTSSDMGTTHYNCHQNYRMGSCGDWQEGAGLYPNGSHGLCPYLYDSAFTRNFAVNNRYNCSSNRMVKNPSKNVKMGYLAKFNR